jgi:hypothetical protein
MMIDKDTKMITLILTEEQASFLEAALEKACDNECDGEYLNQYVTVLKMLRGEMQNA